MLFRALRRFREVLQLPAAARAEAAQTALLSQKLDVVISWLTLLDARQTDHEREMRLLLGQMSRPPVADRAERLKAFKPAPAKTVFVHSVVCRQDSFETPYFLYWTAELGLSLHYHRKLWEFVFICQVLHERGLLKPGVSGLGFGVGEEPLAAYFAGMGCRITGTDLAPAAAEGAGWVDTAQHARGKEALRRPDLCPTALFDANVDFRFCDMNAVPDDLTGYDFCWSACALEHLGSIEKGLAYIERSLDCLKPGGLAVHTTEFNVNSDNETLEQGSTVLFRRRDLIELSRRLTDKGHTVAPLDLDPGDRPMDVYLDTPPYRQEPHVKIALAGYATTSVGLIVRKKA